jgi:hypothetical protein
MLEFGPFQFHLTEKTVRRLLPLLPDEPTWKDIRFALRVLDNEDREQAHKSGGK